MSRFSFSIAFVALLIGCSGDGSDGGDDGGPTPPERPPPLAPLPPHVPASAEWFESSIRCGQCHLAKDGSPDALRDAAGRDVSPVALWRTSMMALAARDPFYLAAWNEERSRFPDRVDDIDRTCARCHAPMGAVTTQNKMTFEELTSATTPEARLGRDGVSCALCHQIQDDNLGTERSFSGGFVIDSGREIYGPHVNPDTQPMMFFLNYTPTQSDHILSSEVCATCHTVIVTPLAPDGSPRGTELVEQATYFEWLNSDFGNSQSESAASCATCHVPTTDVDDVPIRTRIATTANLDPRDPFGRHVFVGGGAYLSRLLARNREWAGIPDFEEGLLETAAASEAHLATAATLEVVSSERSGGLVSIAVRVVNRTGHKLPTGYPTRRMWLRIVARDTASAVVFEAGEVDANGSLAGDELKTVRSHTDRVTSDAETVVWQAVLVDGDGRPTPRPLAAVSYAKDSRILPAGFSMNHRLIARMTPVGVEADGNFIAGSDTVTFEFAAETAVTVELELLYQSLSPGVAAAHEEWPTPAGVRFAEMVADFPPVPVSMAELSHSIP